MFSPLGMLVKFQVMEVNGVDCLTGGRFGSLMLINRMVHGKVKDASPASRGHAARMNSKVAHPPLDDEANRGVESEYHLQAMASIK